MQTDYGQVWNDCLLVIKENIAEQSFNTWFQPIKPVRLEENVLTIQVPSQFFYEWLEENYVHILKLAIDKVIGKEGRLEYSVVVDGGFGKKNPVTVNYPNSGSAEKAKSVHKEGGNGTAVAYASPFEYKEVNPFHQDSRLNGKYTFDNYIEGSCNRLARSAGYAVAERPGLTSFNPLMIYGGVGLGKTHLIQAIGNEIKQTVEGSFVLYVSSETFTKQFVDAIKMHKVPDFHNYYLNVDVLIIDDVQFLAGKDQTQEIFFNIFNHLHQSGKQIILTSDCPPRDLKGLHERLHSRFKWGLTADLTSPDFETRLAIIQKKMHADGIHIPEDVVEYLAYSVDTNIRDLEGVLISLIAHATLNRIEIDLELAKQTLKNIVHDIDSEVSLDYIQKTVGEFFKITVAAMKDKIRKKEIVIARQVAMYFAKEYTNHSLKYIGYHFGGRDHSTVIHAVQSVNDMLDTNANFRAQMGELRKKMKMKLAAA